MRAMLIGCFLATTWGPSPAGAQALPRYFDPPELPQDVRLGKPVDLDHPSPFQPRYPDKASWEKRAQRVREQMLVANGLWPMPPRPPVEPTIHGSIDRDAYVIQKVYFASLPGHYVTGNLYRPKGRSGKMPGVLCPHGHWANGRFYENKNVDAELASGAEKTPEGARFPLQARCAMLARMGCVVFHYDMVGYADSQAIKHRVGFNTVDHELRLQSAMGLQTWNSLRALDFLANLPDVDASRIGVTGASGGGTQTFVLCAIDPRPAVAFPAVMVSANMQGGCICENCSLFRVGTNNVEMAALFAPKPLALSAANDWTRDVEMRGLPELRSIYGLYGAEDLVTARYFAFGHNYNQVSREMMYAWFNKHLKLGFPEPIAEQPFVPVPPKDLSVFDEDHPRPKDEADARGVTRFWTETSDRQLAELARNPDQYREVVWSALRAMVCDELAEVGEVIPHGFKSVKADGFEVHKTLLERNGSGERIPAIGLVPPGYQGTVAIWVHPEGKASVFTADDKPVPAVRELLDANVAVFAPDLFLTGEFHLPGSRTPPPSMEQPHHKDVPFVGFLTGYNRTILANRVHDLLTVMGFMPSVKARKVFLVAQGSAGVWGLLAQALASDRIAGAVIDLNGFDFDQVKDVKDENFLPGGRKYGGVMGFLPLYASGETHVFNAPRPPGQPPARTVTLHEGKAGAEEILANFVRAVKAANP